jgi:hypothetical protein
MNKRSATRISATLVGVLAIGGAASSLALDHGDHESDDDHGVEDDLG